MSWQPKLVRSHVSGSPALSLGHPLIDEYLRCLAVRRRPHTLLARAYDLKAFFSAVRKDPVDVITSDVFTFVSGRMAISGQMAARPHSPATPLEGGARGVSIRTIERQLASVSELFEFLAARDDPAIEYNPVPSLATRHACTRGGPQKRTPPSPVGTLPPGQIESILTALNTARDRAMVMAMLLSRVRRREVLGLRLGDLVPGEGRVRIREAAGGGQRLLPMSTQFFIAVDAYLARERPPVQHDRLFVVLRGPTRGRPMSADALEAILKGLRKRLGYPMDAPPDIPRPPPRATDQQPWPTGVLFGGHAPKVGCALGHAAGIRVQAL
ncbi:tyrosine-type recombinase/integrase [Streptomyces sp. NPDC007172]|uniref:tyrosine-type recombinase/integrase n=1 Tax=Streptomyces sp. NPDC007172 TaxID=3364776 RepID=UPI00368B8BC3